jgi:hypothetical protein
MKFSTVVTPIALIFSALATTSTAIAVRETSPNAAVLETRTNYKVTSVSDAGCFGSLAGKDLREIGPEENDAWNQLRRWCQAGNIVKANTSKAFFKGVRVLFNSLQNLSVNHLSCA